SGSKQPHSKGSATPNFNRKEGAYERDCGKGLAACPTAPARYKWRLYDHCGDALQGTFISDAGEIDTARTLLALAGQEISLATEGLGGLCQSLSLCRMRRRWLAGIGSDGEAATR